MELIGFDSLFLEPALFALFQCRRPAIFLSPAANPQRLPDPKIIF